MTIVYKENEACGSFN